MNGRFGFGYTSINCWKTIWFYGSSSFIAISLKKTEEEEEEEKKYTE